MTLALASQIVIDADRVNFFRDAMDFVSIARGVEITTKQSWKFARELAELEAREPGNPLIVMLCAIGGDA